MVQHGRSRLCKALVWTANLFLHLQRPSDSKQITINIKIFTLGIQEIPLNKRQSTGQLTAIYHILLLAIQLETTLKSIVFLSIHKIVHKYAETKINWVYQVVLWTGNKVIEANLNYHKWEIKEMLSTGWNIWEIYLIKNEWRFQLQLELTKIGGFLQIIHIRQIVPINARIDSQAEIKTWLSKLTQRIRFFICLETVIEHKITGIILKSKLTGIEQEMVSFRKGHYRNGEKSNEATRI